MKNMARASMAKVMEVAAMVAAVTVRAGTKNTMKVRFEWLISFADNVAAHHGLLRDSARDEHGPKGRAQARRARPTKRTRAMPAPTRKHST